ncbi:hypothetical protein AB0G71_12080 [Streptomyces sp. NPDC020403]
MDDVAGSTIVRALRGVGRLAFHVVGTVVDLLAIRDWWKKGTERSPRKGD